MVLRTIFSRKFQIASLGAVSIAAYGFAAFNLLSPGGFPKISVPAAFAHVSEKKPLTVAAFKADADQYSKDNMMVVLLRRNACDICDSVVDGLHEARDRLRKKIDHGFTIYDLNADQNPEVAALFRQKDPQAMARLHVLYNNEKIYESQGISEEPRHLFEVLEMVQALAEGQVSNYDKYQPSQIFPPIAP